MDRKWLYGGAVAAAAIAATVYMTGAKAADLGGNGLADLEERVAELEAVTARKGNRRVSLTISGYVSHAVMMWDDGGAKDTYFGDGGAVSSRFRMVGTAKISPDMTAGFTYEFGAHNNLLGSMSQGVGGDDLGGAIALRDSTVWLRHKNLGMVKLGHGSTATDNLILVDLSNSGVALTPDVALFNGSFGTRIDTLTIGGTPVPAASGILTGVTWAQLFNGGVSFDTARRNHVLYETPSLAGFTVAAAVAENSFWDVALKYAGEFGGFRFAMGIGYSLDKEAPAFGLLGLTASSVGEVKGSASLMHVASGLFLNAAGGQRDIKWSVTGFGHTVTAADPQFWHVAGGWSKNVFGIGATTLFAEYQKADDMIGYSVTGPILVGSITSEATMWGVGAIQHIDSAAMEIYLTYKSFTGSVDGSLASPVVGSAALQMKDFQAVIMGARISF